MSWAVGVSLCLLLPRLMIFRLPARSAIFLFSRTSVGFRWILRAQSDSVTNVMGPCRDSTCCREKFRFLQVPSFLYFILLFHFLYFFLLFSYSSFLYACGLLASLSLRRFLFWLHLVAVPETVNCLGRDVSPWQRTRPQAECRLLFLLLLLLSRLTNTFTQIHTNTQT